MILLQLSAGQGPLECCRAVALALKAIEKQCKSSKLDYQIIEVINAERKGCFKSALIRFDDSELAKQVVSQWQGAMVWICQSTFRPKHKRKNWYFSSCVYEVEEREFDKHIVFQSCRASGAGGQHVNTTNSTIRATHVATGLSVRVEQERSQHANKRLAIALLYQKLTQHQQQTACAQDKARWQQHWEVQRGKPVRTFVGDKFTCKS